MIWSDDFLKIPAAPRYVIEKPEGTAPFSLLSEGALRVRYRATPECQRVEAGPRTDPDNKVGIRLEKENQYGVQLGIRVQTPVQKSKSVLLQFHQVKLANPPLSLELVYDRFRLVRLHYPEAWPGSNPNREVLWERPCVRRAWHEFYLQFRLGSDPEGNYYTMIDLDGELREFDGPNCYGDPQGVTPKFGIYRAGAKDGTVPLGQETVVDFRHLRILAD